MSEPLHRERRVDGMRGALCAGLALTLIVGSLNASAAASGSTSLGVDEDHLDRLVARMGGRIKRSASRHFVTLYDFGQVFAESRSRIAERTFTDFTGTMEALGFDLPPLMQKLVLVVFRDQGHYLDFGTALQFDAQLTDAFYSFKENVVVLFDANKDANYLALRERIDRQQTAVRGVQDQLRRVKGPPRTVIRLHQPGKGTRTLTRGQLARELSRDNRRLRKLESELRWLATRQNTAKTRHEVAHQLAANLGIQPRGPIHPFWVTEGLACQFEVPMTPSARKRGAFSQHRLQGFRTARRGEYFRPLTTLLTAGIRAEMGRDERLALYSQAWGLFFFLRSERPEAFRAYLTALPRTAGAGSSGAALFAEHFGDDLGQVEREYVNYIEKLH